MRRRSRPAPKTGGVLTRSTISARQERAAPIASTSDRIIDAAERLFGTCGIEATSIRQITIEADASNNSAVTYHFGDRANLVREIWRRRLPAIEVARAELLRQLVAEGSEADANALARALVMPVYDVVDASGRHRYAAFLRQALRWEPGRALRQEAMALSPSSASAFGMFRRLFPRVSDEIFAWRCLAGTGLFFDLVFDRDRDAAAGLPIMAEPVFVEEAVGLLVACCAA